MILVMSRSILTNVRSTFAGILLSKNILADYIYHPGLKIPNSGSYSGISVKLYLYIVMGETSRVEKLLCAEG